MKEVAIITGGTRGIGLGIAQSLAKHGIHLVLNGMRDPEEVRPVIDQLKRQGVEVLYVAANVAKAIDRETIISQAISYFGQINHLVNNAGVAPAVRNDILDMTEESYDRVMDINLKSAVFLSQMAAKKMISYKNKNPDFSSSIINISSVSATMASTGRAEYCMSKAGMAMLTQTLSARLGVEGIPVYEVRPGVIATDMTSAVKEKYDKLISEGLFVDRRWGQPEDVGKAVLSLVRRDLAYSTGQVIMVDGGLSNSRL